MATENKTAKPWGGRFTEATDRFVEEFTQSVSFDRRLAPYDVQGSIAHVTMLARVGVLTEAEAEQIRAGLSVILNQIQAGEFNWKQELEDVHMNIEAALVERIAEVGKKVHKVVPPACLCPHLLGQGAFALQAIDEIGWKFFGPAEVTPCFPEQGL